MIIIEGPDNSGKSTLAKALKDQAIINEVWHAGGPGFNPERLRDEMWRVATNLTVAHDRANFISGPIYERAFNSDEPKYDFKLCQSHTEYLLKHELVFIIYCKGHGEFTAREEESEEYNRKVEASNKAIRFHYNDFFSAFLHKHDNCVTYNFEHGPKALQEVIAKLCNFQRHLFTKRAEFESKDWSS